MAASERPLVWEFYREVEGQHDVGSVVHYYDEASQSIVLSSSKRMETRIADVPEGHWRTSEQEPKILIGNKTYDLLTFDHAYNGVLFGMAKCGNEIVFLRYVYALECSYLILSGSVSASNSNAITQLKVNLMNIKDIDFENDMSIFQPGSKAVLKFIIGEEILSACTAHLDSIDYDSRSQTVPFSARNNIGFRLAESTFDDCEEITGTLKQVLAKIFEIGGVKKYLAQDDKVVRTHKFNSTQTLMSGIDQLCDFYAGLKYIEAPNGTIIVGYDSFIKNYQRSDYYVFDKGTVFKNKIKRASDRAYSKVMVTGKDEEDEDLTPAIVEVNNFQLWNLPVHKTYHENVPKGFTQSELNAYAKTLANTLQYVGVSEDYTCAIRPQLLIGDIAASDNGDGTSTTIGIVTSVKHNFGKSGFTTEFSTDSGGLLANQSRAANGDEGIITVSKSLDGYTRKQTLKDLIQVVNKSPGAGEKILSETVKVISTPNAETLNGKTYEQIVKDVTAFAIELPAHSAEDDGKVLKVQGGTLVWGADNTGGGGSSTISNIVNYDYKYSSSSESHSLEYMGITGNILLLLVMTRGEMVLEPEGWERIGILTESGDKDAGSVEYAQYVYAYKKVCVGQETIEYSQAENNTSITCIIEFEGVSGFEILENTRQENIATTGSSNSDFECVRTSTRMAIWVTTSVYFNNETYIWQISDNGIWAISDNHEVQPRLGVMIDNRPAPINFRIGSGMSGRYASAICIQTIPAGIS